MLEPVLAALPIVLILGLMLGLSWPAARAGAAGLAVALALAWLVFARPGTAYGEQGPPAATAGAMGEALFTAATILWIIFPALCIHQLQTRTGAVETLRGTLGRLTPDPRLAAVIVAWFFALFIEGAAGFGTTIALAAPLLVGLGLSPVAALSAALLGHAVGVSFGAVGTPVLPQVAATGLDPRELSGATGLFHGLLGWVMLLFTMAVVRRALPEEAAGGRPLWGYVAAAAGLFLAPMLAIAWWVGPELPTLGGALIGGVGFVAILRARGAPAEGGGAGGAELARAAAPYLALIAAVLATRLVGPLREALTGVELAWSWREDFRGSFQPLYHPGTMLMLSFALGALWQRAPVREVRAALVAAALQLGGVALALVAMLALSRVLVHAGMIDALARTAAAGLGGAWPAVAPLIGVLGTFVTGSATASNILFTDFQQATAQDAGLPVLVVVAAQGFGAAVGNIVCPHNIIAGGATVGLSGEVGPVLRRTLAACLVYAALGGALALALARLMPAA
ncbi:MAG TPA: L-lactate permease [Chloroflexaceae bacterium]|nr:L-lactate permease [Chloroflexaceae bacterium]